MDKLIETKELYTNFYTYEGTVRALNGVSLSMKPGETYGLVGESGCGKSVSVRSMMRIVQSPGKIESGQINLFMSDKDHQKGIDILKRSETYMQSVRGNSISMIFQEASSSLNPVLKIGDQVGESFVFHRHEEMVKEAIDRLLEKSEKSSNGLANFFRNISVKLLQSELNSIEKYDLKVAEIDKELLEIEDNEDEASIARKHSLNFWRDRCQEYNFLIKIQRKIPILNAYQRGIGKAIRRNVLQLLTELGIPNPSNIIDRYPHELSGGMQQRIVIAIALACHPELLIADEPTSNLDVTIQAQILDMIKDLKKTKISSVLFITHDLGVIAEVCDRVSVMYAGDVCETATVKDLFKNPQHPYTKGLLNSVPKVEQGEKLATIPGVVPNLVTPPSGCRFHPRCPYAMEICKNEKPEIFELNDEHSTSCHLYSQKEDK
ncbi:MAG: ATP-binding cassette domain-containing protein [Spirochaetaceae bacterium]|nr:ATP-binding cassette domain-containing protein [Spirochaetaceae bacterium]